jgi:hypothetical protein
VKIEPWSDAVGKLEVGDKLLALDGSPCEAKPVGQCIDASRSTHMVVVLPVPTPRPRRRRRVSWGALPA